MTSLESNGVQYSLMTTQLIKTIYVSVSIKVNGTNLSAINAIGRCGMIYEEPTCPQLSTAALLLASYARISKALTQSAVDELKKRVALIGYGYNSHAANEHYFYINAQTQNLAAAKRFIKLCLAGLSPGKENGKYYKQLMLGVGCKVDSNLFKHGANLINAGLRQGSKAYHVLIVSNTRFDAEKLQLVTADTAKVKFINAAFPDAKPPTHLKEHQHIGLPPVTPIYTISLKGVHLGMFKSYIESVIGTELQAYGGKLLIPKVYEKIVSPVTNKDTYSRFVERKYKKDVEHLDVVLAAMAILHLYDDPVDISGYKNETVASLGSMK
jgi:hypothetical protein